MELVLGVWTVEQPSDIFDRVYGLEPSIWGVGVTKLALLQKDAKVQSFFVVTNIDFSPLKASWKLNCSLSYFSHVSALNEWPVFFRLYALPNMSNWLFIPELMRSEKFELHSVFVHLHLIDWLSGSFYALFVIDTPLES